MKEFELNVQITSDQGTVMAGSYRFEAPEKDPETLKRIVKDIMLSVTCGTYHKSNLKMEDK